MQTKINILTNQGYLSRGFFDLYPLIKWKTPLKENGFKLKFFNYHKNDNIYKSDIILIHHRYYEQIIKKNFSPNGFEASNLDFMVDFILEAQKKGCKILIFEGGDSGGTRQSTILKYADLMLKKQVFKDKSLYLRNNVEHRVQIWLPDSVPELSKFKAIPPVRKEDLRKISIGWNIGLCDYRSFPDFVKRFSPLNSFTIPNWLYSQITYTQPSKSRPYLFSYRGKNTGHLERRTHNRRLMMEQIAKNKDKLNDSFFLGGKIPFKQYANEMRSSKIGLSPFGWGEICFRDFEVMISGSILMKPDISHLDTFPNYFDEYKTYIPTSWDHEDLIDKLIRVRNNYEDYIAVAKNAQNIFKKYNEDAKLFTKHFSQIINQL